MTNPTKTQAAFDSCLSPMILVASCLIFLCSTVKAQHTFDPQVRTPCEKAYNALDLAEIEVNMCAKRIFRDTIYKPTLDEATQYINSTTSYKELWFEACTICSWGNCSFQVRSKPLSELTDMYYRYRKKHPSK